MMDLKLTLDKFTGGDFELWKLKAQTVMEMEGSWPFIQKEVAIDDNDPKADQMRKLQMLALYRIRSSLEDRELGIIRECSTPHSAWTTLVQHFLKQDVASKMAIRTRLHESRHRAVEDLQSHMNEL